MKIIPIPMAPGLRGERQPQPVIRLPVAPKALARVRWAADTKPPMPAMTPTEAMAWLEQVERHDVAVARVECCGPGDPLAVPGRLFETMALLRRHYPEVAPEIATLGLSGEAHARQLADLGVRRVILLVDAVEPEAATKVYAWVRPGTKTIPLPQAAAVLVEEQARAVTAFARLGMAVHIQTTVCPGVNDGQVEAIARAMAALGAESMTLLPAHPESEEDKAVVARGSALAARHLPLVAAQPAMEPGWASSPLPGPTPARPNVAVVSIGGMEVDLHLGHAIKALIYGPREDGLIALLASRELPEPGGGATRWQEMAGILHDCFALLAVSAGESPKQALADHGISVLITGGEIDGAVDLLYGGGKKKRSAGSGQQKKPR